VRKFLVENLKLVTIASNDHMHLAAKKHVLSCGAVKKIRKEFEIESLC
jgi:hypothetical protein